MDDILTIAKHYFDELFPPDVFLHQLHPNLPIIFCIDNHRMAVEETDVSIDDEFEMINEEENNNSFIYTLCQRLAGEFAFKHIQYGDFDQLKNEMIQSMGRCSGYIIDHFPTSLDDLQRFQSEVKIFLDKFEFIRVDLLKDRVLVNLNLHRRTSNGDEL